MPGKISYVAPRNCRTLGSCLLCLYGNRATEYTRRGEEIKRGLTYRKEYEKSGAKKTRKTEREYVRAANKSTQDIRNCEAIWKRFVECWDICHRSVAHNLFLLSPTTRGYKTTSTSRLFTFLARPGIRCVCAPVRVNTLFIFMYLFQLEHGTKWKKNTLPASLRVYRLLWLPFIIQSNIFSLPETSIYKCVIYVIIFPVLYPLLFFLRSSPFPSHAAVVVDVSADFYFERFPAHSHQP